MGSIEKPIRLPTDNGTLVASHSLDGDIFSYHRHDDDEDHHHYHQ